MIWNKQIYIYDVSVWLTGDNPRKPPPESHKWIRNVHWRHIVSYRIFSMPDKWEYPWFVRMGSDLSRALVCAHRYAICKRPSVGASF